MDTHYDSCPVCHEAVMVYAIGNCDHPICYRCSTRMRILCEQSYCPICRTDLNQVYMIHEIKKFTEIPRTGYVPNRKYKIFFEDNTIKEKFEKLLEHRCPKCKNKERTLKALQHHMSKQHTLFYCDLCLEHLRIFTSERKVYSRAELATHRRHGDKDDKSYKEHPLCQFCDERYFDNDDLFRHLRKDHYFCHFCDADGSQDYYNDYADLRDHFKVRHYLCEEGECAHAQFTNAFKSNIDYKAHMANEHARSMSKQQAKQARTIDVNINLAPRDRRRDRGVIGGDDYQEVHQRQTRPYSSRGPHPRQKDRFRGDDMERAIQASLSVMKEEDMKKTEKPKKERSSPLPVIEHTEQEFPTLGNVSVGAARPTGKESPIDSEHRDSDSEKSSESLAKLLAKNTSQSVQHGSMSLNDFPSLHDDTIKPVGADLLHKLIVTNAAPQQKIKTAKNEKVHVPKPQNPAQFYEKKMKSGPLEDDFPGLPSAKSASSNNLSWVNKIPTKQAPSIKVVVNNSSSTGHIKKVKSEHRSRKPFDSENDFPTLGSNGASVPSTGWLKQVNEPKPQKSKPKPIDWFDGHDSDEFSIDNIKGDKDNTQLIEDTHSKNKRKKKKKNKTNNEDSLKQKSFDQCRLNENSTLDNIAFSLLSDVPKHSFAEESENVIASDSAGKIDEISVTMETEPCLISTMQENTRTTYEPEDVKRKVVKQWKR
ncbi:hypothetical protein FSP39_016257 [Pinctada imbricata]|uniref:RING-type E3 ubiquitin transferase n=1 Tax=Pinctada imbricata TaxID=66713 RepID=A0AA89BPX4_PINIB|nr:hypothetical protein FSP39_016257 [Pinctada imbricata]